jgi:hypothetical protein
MFMQFSAASEAVNPAKMLVTSERSGHRTRIHDTTTRKEKTWRATNALTKQESARRRRRASRTVYKGVK